MSALLENMAHSLRLGGALLGLLLAVLAANATGGGLEWLATQQLTDGSGGRSATSLLTMSQSTGEVLPAQRALDQGGAPSFGQVLACLTRRAVTDGEPLTRKAAVNVQPRLVAHRASASARATKTNS